MEIRFIPGELVNKDGEKCNILEILGIEVEPLDVENTGRSGSIAAVVIGDKQYALSDVLEEFAKRLLPAVAEDDEGNTLIVSNGEWTIGIADGGMDPFS